MHILMDILFQFTQSDQVPKSPFQRKLRPDFWRIWSYFHSLLILGSVRNFLDQPYISRSAQNPCFRMCFYHFMLMLCLHYLPLLLNDCLASEDLHHPGDAGDLPLEGESVQFLCLWPWESRLLERLPSTVVLRLHHSINRLIAFRSAACAIWCLLHCKSYTWERARVFSILSIF